MTPSGIEPATFRLVAQCEEMKGWKQNFSVDNAPIQFLIKMSHNSQESACIKRQVIRTR